MAASALLLAALVGVGFGQEIVEPDPRNVPEHCWGEPRLIKDGRVKDKARDPTAVARMVLGHVIVSKSSNGARGRTFGNRMADIVAGKPENTQYAEAQLNTCLEKNNERIYHESGLELPSLPHPERTHRQRVR